MWQIILLLVAGSCYSSGEEYNVNVVELSPAPPVPAADGTRVVGGFPGQIEQFPFAVQIVGAVSGSTQQMQCGGSLITVRHVLSAAHCFVNDYGVMFSPSIYTVRAGATNFNTGGSTHRVSRIINHERYNVRYARANDVAVLLLASNVTLSASVGLATIPGAGSAVYDNSPLTVVGWGHLWPGANFPSPVLQYGNVYKVNNNLCAERYRQLGLQQNRPLPVTSEMMCSGILDFGGVDACQGDSGGPVIYMGPMGMVVVGVTSWGEGCALAQYPGVNARVASYTPWILETVRTNDAAPFLGQTSVCLLLLSFLISKIFQ